MNDSQLTAYLLSEIKFNTFVWWISKGVCAFEYKKKNGMKLNSDNYRRDIRNLAESLGVQYDTIRKKYFSKLRSVGWIISQTENQYIWEFEHMYADGSTMDDKEFLEILNISI